MTDEELRRALELRRNSQSQPTFELGAPNEEEEDGTAPSNGGEHNTEEVVVQVERSPEPEDLNERIETDEEQSIPIIVVDSAP